MHSSGAGVQLACLLLCACGRVGFDADAARPDDGGFDAAVDSGDSGGDTDSGAIDFDAGSRVRVTYRVVGDGTGVVVPASGPTISCGAQCLFMLPGDSVRATPAAGSEFTGWMGADVTRPCDGRGPCAIGSADIELTAGFGRRGGTATRVFSAPLVRAVMTADDGRAYASFAEFVFAGTSDWVLDDLVGLEGSPGYVDGVGLAARFFELSRGLDRLGPDRLLVTDLLNNSIREIEISTQTVTTWAGTGVEGMGEGPRTSAALRFPRDLVVLPSGIVIIADEGNDRVVAVEGGNLRTLFGSDAYALAVGADGALYVADGFGGVILRTPTPTSTSPSEFLGRSELPGYLDGVAADALVRGVEALAVLEDGTLLFVDGPLVRAWRADRGVVTVAGGGSSTASPADPLDIELAPHDLWVTGPRTFVVAAADGIWEITLPP